METRLLIKDEYLVESVPHVEPAGESSGHFLATRGFALRRYFYDYQKQKVMVETKC